MKDIAVQQTALNAGSVEDMLAALNHFLRPPLLMMRLESANDAAAVHIL
jgi:hypothetical protein